MPTSFADGRYQIKRFLGEGGKKKVYLTHDGVLDRDVAFTLIKTGGPDETSRTRVSREALAMGRICRDYWRNQRLPNGKRLSDPSSSESMWVSRP